MPTYQYVCTDCGSPLEAVQSFTDDALTVCPACEGRLRKVFSAVGVVFKGSGFYRNDSRAGNGAKESAAKSSTAKESSTSSSTSGDSSSSASSTSSSSDSAGSSSPSSSSDKKAAATPAA